MTEPGREQAEPPKAAGIIERLESGLAMGEEPASFIAALENVAEPAQGD